jgi:hypothetical protein
MADGRPSVRTDPLSWRMPVPTPSTNCELRAAVIVRADRLLPKDRQQTAYLFQCGDEELFAVSPIRPAITFPGPVARKAGCCGRRFRSTPRFLCQPPSVPSPFCAASPTRATTSGARADFSCPTRPMLAATPIPTTAWAAFREPRAASESRAERLHTSITRRKYLNELTSPGIQSLRGPGATQ